MKKLRLISCTIALLLGGTCVLFTLDAQPRMQNGKHMRRGRMNIEEQPAEWLKSYSFDYVRRLSPWLSSSNAAQIGTVAVNKMSMLELSFDKDNGGWRNYFESDNSYRFGAHTESYYRLSKRVTLYGNVLYDNFHGQNMTGSMLLDPYSAPFDIVENTTENSGRKQKETYGLSAGVGVNLFKGLNFGAQIDYTAINYAKMKDMRHINTLLDLNVSAGVSYSLPKFLEVGVNYIYRRNIESLYFNMYGTTDKQYFSLISYGSFFGTWEMLGETGYTTINTAQPLVRLQKGGAAQINLKLAPRFSFFNEFTYLMTDGFYGIRASNKLQYSTNDGTTMQYCGILTYAGNAALHRLKLCAAMESLTNNENIYRRQTDENSVTTIEYLGVNEMLSRDQTKLSAEYTASWGVENFNPKWEVRATGAYFQRKQTVSVYPFYRKSDVNTMEGSASILRSFVRQKGMWKVCLGGGYGTGSGTPKDDGHYAPPSSSQAAPRQSDEYLNWEFEYLTANRFNVNASVRYARFFKRFSAYIEAAGSYTSAQGVEYVAGNNFTSISIKAGCTF